MVTKCPCFTATKEVSKRSRNPSQQKIGCHTPEPPFCDRRISTIPRRRVMKPSPFPVCASRRSLRPHAHSRNHNTKPGSKARHLNQSNSKRNWNCAVFGSSLAALMPQRSRARPAPDSAYLPVWAVPPRSTTKPRGETPRGGKSREAHTNPSKTQDAPIDDGGDDDSNNHEQPPVASTGSFYVLIYYADGVAVCWGVPVWFSPRLFAGHDPHRWSGQKAISWVESGRVRTCPQTSRVGSGRVRGLSSMTLAGTGHPDPTRPDPTRPNLTRENRNPEKTRPARLVAVARDHSRE